MPTEPSSADIGGERTAYQRHFFTRKKFTLGKRAQFAIRGFFFLPQKKESAAFLEREDELRKSGMRLFCSREGTKWSFQKADHDVPPEGLT